jgi:hypothetical protein
LNFLFRKYPLDRKVITEEQLLDQLTRQQLRFPPLALEMLRPERDRGGGGPDAVLRASWRHRRWEFDVECRAFATPRSLREAIIELKFRAEAGGRLPLVVAPYLSEERLRELEDAEVSGLDLSGNGVVVVPGELLVFRSGAPNRFPFPVTLKNAYRGVTSLVARVLLLRPSYPSVTEVQEEIRRRGGDLVLSTVSKALKLLAEELIIGRSPEIRLLQPDKLLERLTREYRAPKVTLRAQGKLPGGREALLRTLGEKAETEGIPLVATGGTSAPLYTVMARGELLSVYTPQLDRLLVGLPFRETSRFPDLEVLETDEAPVYFDLRQRDGFHWASPLQTYLELMDGDKRDRETAAQLRDQLLGSVADPAGERA